MRNLIIFIALIQAFVVNVVVDLLQDLAFLFVEFGKVVDQNEAIEQNCNQNPDCEQVQKENEKKEKGNS